MASPPPPGVYVPVPTFFAPKSAPGHDAATPPLDLDMQGAHAVYLARAGVRGLVVLGSTGEAVHVHPRERATLLRGVRERLAAAGFGHVGIMAGTATHGIAETVEQLAGARDAGAQWGLVLAPGFNAAATTQEGIVRWFTAVADRSPLPLLVYHYPGVSNMVRVAPATYATLSRHPNIVGCKLSHGDVSQLAQIALNPAIDGARFRVFTGLGQQLLPVVAVGCAGAIDGSAGFFPRAMVRLYDLSAKARPTDAEAAERRRLQFRISSMEELVVTHGIVGIKEAVSRLRGFGDADGTRLPLHGGIPGGAAEWARWQAVLDAVQEDEDALESVDQGRRIDGSLAGP